MVDSFYKGRKIYKIIQEIWRRERNGKGSSDWLTLLAMRKTGDIKRQTAFNGRMKGWGSGWNGNKTNSDWSFGRQWKGQRKGESRVIELWSINCQILIMGCGDQFNWMKKGKKMGKTGWNITIVASYSLRWMKLMECNYIYWMFRCRLVNWI